MNSIMECSTGDVSSSFTRIRHLLGFQYDIPLKGVGINLEVKVII